MLPVSCHTPWPSWTLGLRGWTDLEILTSVTPPDFCCQGDSYKLKKLVNVLQKTKLTLVICVFHVKKISNGINFRRMQTLPSRTYPIYDPATAPLVSSNSSLPSGLSRGGFLRRKFGSGFKKREDWLKMCPRWGDLTDASHLKRPKKQTNNI